MTCYSHFQNKGRKPGLQSADLGLSLAPTQHKIISKCIWLWVRTMTSKGIYSFLRSVPRTVSISTSTVKMAWIDLSCQSVTPSSQQDTGHREDTHDWETAHLAGDRYCHVCGPGLSPHTIQLWFWGIYCCGDASAPISILMKKSIQEHLVCTSVRLWFHLKKKKIFRSGFPT